MSVYSIGNNLLVKLTSFPDFLLHAVQMLGDNPGIGVYCRLSVELIICAIITCSYQYIMAYGWKQDRIELQYIY